MRRPTTRPTMRDEAGTQTPAEHPNRVRLPRRALRWKCGVRRVVEPLQPAAPPLHAHREPWRERVLRGGRRQT
eukprot:4775781-Alexandrium_andersonii.AAC.1